MRQAVEVAVGSSRDEAIELLRRHWKPARDAAVHLALVRELLTTEWAERRWRHVALRGADGRMIAGLSLYELFLRLGTRRLVIGGIGSVVVDPDRRLEGHGRTLLEGTHDLLRSEGFDGALLFSCIGEAFYRRLGYETLALSRLRADLDEPVAPQDPEPSSSTFRPFEAADLAAVKALFDTSAALQELAVLRTDDLWTFDLLMPAVSRARLGLPSDPHENVVSVRDGAIVAYLRTRVDADKSELVVTDCAFAPGARSDVAALVQLARTERPGGVPRWLSAAAPARFANLCGAGSPTWKPEERDIMMLRSFGGFTVPSALPPDSRTCWQADWF